MGVKDTLKKIIGIEDLESDEPEKEEVEKAMESLKAEKETMILDKPLGESKSQKPPFVGFESSKTSASSPKIERSTAPMAEKRFTVGNTSKLKVILIEPKNITECQKLVDSLKANKPVIIKLDKLERDAAKQIYDFMLGAIYAINGSVSKITNNIILFAPNNISVDEQIENKQPEKIDESNLWRGNN